MAGVGSQVFKFFREKGLTPQQAAGVVGNTQQESGNNPNSPGGGLIQGQGGRTSSGSLSQQLNGIWGELQGPERATLQALKGAKTPQEAALIFSKRFERPGIPMNEKRVQYAQEALKNYGGMNPGPTAQSASAAPTAPSQGESSGIDPQVIAALLSKSQGTTTEPAGPSLQPSSYPGANIGPKLPQSVESESKGTSPATLAALVSQASEATAEGGAGHGQTHAGTPTPGAPQAQGAVASILSEANHIAAAKVPYLWGGGHQGKVLAGGKVTPLDCSGAVSAVLGINPKVSGEFEQWGQGGKGKSVTIYANPTHVLMEVNGRFFGTSASNPGGGAGWIKPGVISPSYLQSFTARHPPGL